MRKLIYKVKLYSSITQKTNCPYRVSLWRFAAGKGEELMDLCKPLFAYVDAAKELFAK